MAEKNVLLRLGTALGPGGFASLESFIRMAKQAAMKVAELSKELDEATQVYRRLKIDTTKAETSLKGLADSTEVWRGANRLTLAGLQATAEQFETLSLVALKASRDLGDDFTTAFNGIIGALSGGETEYLKRLGMRISESATATEKLNLFMRDAEPLLRGFKVEIETTSEAIGALENDLDTVITVLWSDSQSGSFGRSVEQVHDALDQTIGIMRKYPGLLQEVGVEAANTSIALKPFVALGDEIGRRFDALSVFIEKFRDQLNLTLGPMKTFAKYGTGIGAAINLIDKGFGSGVTQSFEDILSQKIQEEARVEAGWQTWGGEDDFGFGAPTDVTEFVPGQAKTVAGYKGTKGKGKGGGGGGKTQPDFGWASGLAQQQAAGIQAAKEQQLELNAAFEGARYERDQILATEAAIYERRREQWDIEAQQMEAQRVYDQERLEYLRGYEVYHVSHYEALLGVEQRYVDESTALWHSSLMGKAKSMETWFGYMSLLTETSSTKLFYVGKGFKLAEATMAMYSGAVKAYESQLGIPYAGPYLGGLAAAAYVAFSIENIRNIMKTKPGGGGGAASASIGGGGGGYGGAGAGDYGAGQGGGGSYASDQYTPGFGYGGKGGDTYIFNGSIFTTEDMAEEMKRVKNEFTATGRWPNGWEAHS